MKSLLFSAALTVVTTLGAQAAEITLRPDLAPRLEKLKTFYSDNRPAFATEVWNPSDDPSDGVVLVSGPIEKGDAAMLRRVLLKNPDADDEQLNVPRPFHVILNSPGGNLLEAIEMGQFLAGWRYGNGGESLGGVFVLNGQRCMSACAMIFSLAVADRDENTLERFVEVGAELGFHMPFLPPDQAAQSAEIGAAMDLTYSVMSEFLKLVSSGRVPIALAQNALYYRESDEFFTLRGGLLTRFMGFEPVASDARIHVVSSDALTAEDATEICRILEFSTEGGFPSSDMYEWWNIDEPVECILAQTIENADRRTRSNSRTVLLTAGLLADHLGCHKGTLTRHYYHWDWGNRFLEEEEYEEYSAYPRAVAEYNGTEFHYPYKMDWTRTLLSNVNMRDAPGLNGARITRLSEGATVQVTDCRITADSQGVWFKVTASGQTGWVSARYVSRRAPTRHGWYEMIRPAE